MIQHWRLKAVTTSVDLQATFFHNDTVDQDLGFHTRTHWFWETVMDFDKMYMDLRWVVRLLSNFPMKSVRSVVMFQWPLMEAAALATWGYGLTN